MRLLQNATLVTAAKIGKGSVLIDGNKISAVWWAESEDYNFKLDIFQKKNPDAEISDLMECGLTKNSAVFLHIVKESGRCYYMGETSKPRFITIADAARYITGMLYGCRNLGVFFDQKLYRPL